VKVKDDPEMMGTIFSEICLSIDTAKHYHPVFVGNRDNHTEFKVQLQHELDDLEDCFESDESIEKFISRMEGNYEDTNKYVYNSLIPLVATCVEWLMWIRQNPPNKA
jgi:hypothetical protein